MFFAIPLENKPSWRHLPWITLALILINAMVFFGPQSREEKAQGLATEFYLQAKLDAFEFEPFLAHLQDKQSDDLKMAKAFAKANRADLVLDLMRGDDAFLNRLHRHEIITPKHPKFHDWQRQRAQYESMQPAVFTERWSKKFREPITAHPETLLTSTFLHASTSHLVGNMVFLFLFGFTVELSIGRWWYLGFYLVGGVGASLLSAWAYASHVSYGLGASGAISALMSMYAVLYRFQKINFFYSFLFYFNVVRAPAIVLLPVWMGNEIVQQIWSNTNVGYMAHLGGLITGAVLMMSFRATRTARVATPKLSAEQLFQNQVDAAHELAQSMKLEASCEAWGQAVRMQPQNFMAVEKYFDTAVLWPASENFHRAAKTVFRLKASDQKLLDFQHRAFELYFNKAKPHARLKTDDMVQLCKRFVKGGFMADATKLCKALGAMSPLHAEAAELMCVCANASLRANQNEAALAWLPELLKLIPNHPTTQQLVQLQKNN
jgi:membrane associated rhomboid family serine protease